MAIIDVFKKKQRFATISTENVASKGVVPDDVWHKCPKCKRVLVKNELENNFMVCQECGHYLRLTTEQRIAYTCDEGSFQELPYQPVYGNPLNFAGYNEKRQRAMDSTGLSEAITTGRCKINGEDAVVAVMDCRFFMASMGYDLGERLTRAVEYAADNQLPLIIFTASGGARMQEGVVSLMQMAKVSGALNKLSQKRLVYITVLTDPTTGGVTASFAMLGDVILAEKDALVGFAGKRVIEQTIKQRLPDYFQNAEFQLEHGFVDAIVARRDMRQTLCDLIKLHRSSAPPDALPGVGADVLAREVTAQRSHAASAWATVQLARMPNRPTSVYYIDHIFDDFIELHGDRAFRDDPAIVAGLARFCGVPVTVISQEKGVALSEKIMRNFGGAHPEGYRKALRLMRQADKFGRPIICFVDTQGAACGIGAEERGQGFAIANNLQEMFNLRVPVIAIVLSEGGSGGALGIAVANEVYMLENSTYSILSPEGFASILWKDGGRAAEAASIMKIQSRDLLELKIIDGIILEPQPAHAAPKAMADNIKSVIGARLHALMRVDGDTLARRRQVRFRKM